MHSPEQKSIIVPSFGAVHRLRDEAQPSTQNGHLNMACRSLAGFQLVSISTTRLAATRLMPMLPALVDSRNTPAFLLSGRLNELMRFCLRCAVRRGGAVQCGSVSSPVSNQQRRAAASVV